MLAITDNGIPEHSTLARPPACETFAPMTRRDPLEIIDAIEAIRSRNNRNWMDLLRLAYREAPAEATAIVRAIYREDAAVSALVAELAGE